MSSLSKKGTLIGGASACAIAVTLAHGAAAQTPYLPGDFHNHTTCSDGSVSVQNMIDPPFQKFGLEWLIDASHGGLYTRDCRYDDPAYNVTAAGDPGQLYVDTIGASAIKGDVALSNFATGTRGNVRGMWRWQNLQEFNYPLVVDERRKIGKVIFEGLEQIVPGHEHALVTFLDGQKVTTSSNGNANVLAEFEYRFDRADNDLSGGGPVNSWPGKVSNVGLVGNPAHAKALQGIAWQQASYPRTSFNVPTHVERQGPFNPNGNAGWNVEHFRDYNRVGPTVAFGFDTEPGHQAESGRGSYTTNAVGGGTFGGVGVYGARIGGLWDALLGEGRNFWFFGSSDFHNRGTFSPFAPQSTADFYPGEYQKTWVPANLTTTQQNIVTALRAGNAYVTMADIIGGDLSFVACVTSSCATRKATMGQTLKVPPGQSVTVTVSFTQPTTPNYSPYSFANPILKTIGITQPLNRPILDHMDLIQGSVTGVVDPSNTAAYTNATNPSAAMVATFSGGNWTQSGNAVSFSYVIPSVTGPSYIRARGSNLPAGIPNATDASGNPLSDFLRVNIPCTDVACPDHLLAVVGGVPVKQVNYDVRGWADAWLYTNPIYMRPTTSPELLAETNARRAITP